MVDHDAEHHNCSVSSSNADGSLNLHATQQVCPSACRLTIVKHPSENPIPARLYMQIQPGSPLKLKYGVHDTHNLLLTYGFITPNNPSDRFEFTFSLAILMVGKHI